jgi:hypothetical protein
MAYRKNPDNFYLSRTGYGGLMGSIANINKDGFAPTAFHAYPSTLKIMECLETMDLDFLVMLLILQPMY